LQLQLLVVVVVVVISWYSIKNCLLICCPLKLLLLICHPSCPPSLANYLLLPLHHSLWLTVGSTRMLCSINETLDSFLLRCTAAGPNLFPLPAPAPSPATAPVPWPFDVPFFVGAILIVGYSSCFPPPSLLSACFVIYTVNFLIFQVRAHLINRNRRRGEERQE